MHDCILRANPHYQLTCSEHPRFCFTNGPLQSQEHGQNQHQWRFEQSSKQCQLPQVSSGKRSWHFFQLAINGRYCPAGTPGSHSGSSCLPPQYICREATVQVYHRQCKTESAVPLRRRPQQVEGDGSLCGVHHQGVFVPHRTISTGLMQCCFTERLCTRFSPDSSPRPVAAL